MSIFSEQLMFSDDQAVTVTALSTKSIDLGRRDTQPATGNAETADLGVGGLIPLGIHVTEDFAGATSVAVQLVQSDTAPVTAGGVLVSPDAVSTTVAVLLADLVAGYRFNMDLVQHKTTMRYIQLNYVVVGTATAGTIMAGITAGNPAG